MGKEALLARSHFRKNRGTSIGLLALMTLAAILLTVSLLTVFDAYPTAEREGKRLNAADGNLRMSMNVAGLTDEVLGEIVSKDAAEYEIRRGLEYANASVPFGNGEVAINVVVYGRDAFDSKLDRIEIIGEDEKITSDYLYLPYQFYTSSGIKTGDPYKVSFNGISYSLTVRGFINTTYNGCNNSASFMFIMDDDTYKAMRERDLSEDEGIVLVYRLNDGVKNRAFRIGFTNAVKAVNSMTQVGGSTFEGAVANRTFMSMIIAISFVVVAAIVLIVIVLMLANSIRNYIRENMKTVGALKAIGYTGRDIRNSLLILFLTLSAAGSVAGIILGHLAMPTVATIVVAQMGLPYTMSFSPVAVFVPVLFIVLFVTAVTMIATAKIGKIEPMTALRDGLDGHNFKKNRVRLDRSSLGLDMSLALKTMFTNMKQNIITFFVVGFIVFVCTIALLMYENFSRDPKLELLTMETCGGVFAVDVQTKDEAEDYIRSRDDVSNIRRIIQTSICYNGEDELLTNIFDDTDKMNNKNVCYSGRLPRHDNEVAVSGKFAGVYGLAVGDGIELNYGKNEYTYIITGLIQTTNNDGREAIMNEAAASHLMDMSLVPGYIWFDCDSGETSAAVLGDCEERFEGHILTTMNFFDIIDGALTTFKGVAALMLIMMCGISAVVILLVLFLLVKSLLYNKRKDYGIYKAIGYTSGSLIIQTAVSFMPTIILSALLFSVISYFVANPYMNFFMGIFGVVKCTFDIPVPGVMMIALGIVVLAFIFSVILSGRIRKIEAYNMLLAE